MCNIFPTKAVSCFLRWLFRISRDLCHITLDDSQPQRINFENNHFKKWLYCVKTNPLIFYTLTPISIFSMLFFMYWEGEFVWRSKLPRFLGNHFLHSHDPKEWFSSITLRREKMLVTLKVLGDKKLNYIKKGKDGKKITMNYTWNTR